MTNQVNPLERIFKLVPESKIETLKAIDAKFREFIKGLIELNKISDTLYKPLQQKVVASFNELKEEGKYLFCGITCSVIFNSEDDSVPVTTISDLDLKWVNLDLKCVNLDNGLKAITHICEQVTASKVPEPEVLIVTKTEEGGNKYKLSREWINWHSKIFPDYRPYGVIESAAWRAGQKHFKRGPGDKIEHTTSPYSIVEPNGDIDVTFIRITQEKL